MKKILLIYVNMFFIIFNIAQGAQGGFNIVQGKEFEPIKRQDDSALDFARILKKQYNCKIIVFKNRPFVRGLIGLKYSQGILNENTNLNEFEKEKWIKIWKFTSSNVFDSKIWTKSKLIQTGTSDYTSESGSFVKNFKTDFSNSYLYAVFSEVPIKLFWLAYQKHVFDKYNKDIDISNLWLFKIGSQIAYAREVDCEDGTFSKDNYGNVYLNSCHINDMQVKLKNVYILCIDRFFDQCLENNLENLEEDTIIQEIESKIKSHKKQIIDNYNEYTNMCASTPKYIAPKMFKASMPKMVLVEYVCECTIDDYYNYEFSKCIKTHWSVKIDAYTNDGEDYESFNGYVLKSSSIGKKISSILSDGKKHKMILIFHYTQNAEDSDIVKIFGMK